MNEFYNKVKYFEKVEEIQAKTYYHYTSLDALYSIVTSKTIRLTSLKSTNDKKELYYQPNIFLNAFTNVCDKITDETTKKFFGLIKNSIDLNKDAFFKACKEKSYPYALCLSEKKDNLTHWDRYAASCTGVCIGFNISALRVLMQRLAIDSLGVGIYDIEKILYSTEQVENFIKNRLIDMLTVYCDHAFQNNKNILKSIKKDGYIYAVSIYFMISKFVKNDYFVDEDEVRLYHDSASINTVLRLIDLLKSNLDLELDTNLKNNFNQFINKLHLDEEKFYISGRGIRSYKDLCLKDVWGAGTIPEILLGPMCLQNRYELQHFLKANGLEGTKVSISKIPIR